MKERKQSLSSIPRDGTMDHILLCACSPPCQVTLFQSIDNTSSYLAAYCLVYSKFFYPRMFFLIFEFLAHIKVISIYKALTIALIHSITLSAKSYASTMTHSSGFLSRWLPVYVESDQPGENPNRLWWVMWWSEGGLPCGSMTGNIGERVPKQVTAKDITEGWSRITQSKQGGERIF